MASSRSNYEYRLFRDIGKIYVVPKSYTQYIKQIISQLFDATLHQTADRESIISALRSVFSNLQRVSEPAGRGDERVNIIASLLPDFKPLTILDIGAGTGDITTGLRYYYNLPKEHVFAIDQKLPPTVDVTALTYTEDGKIPLPDGSIELIVLFAVLHHIPPTIRSGIMMEINRVLSSHGRVVIREHDDDKDPNFYVYLDLYHLLWYIAKDETSDPLYLLSRIETGQMFQSLNLESIGYHTYPEPNPKRIYHEIFRKIVSTTPVYQFADSTTASYVQAYITFLRQLPASFDSLPQNLQATFRAKYPVITDWTAIIKEAILYLILEATRYVTPINGVHYLTPDSIVMAANALGFPSH